MIACPLCKSESSVTETRSTGDTARRRRHCKNPACLHRFTTIEMVYEASTYRGIEIVGVPIKRLERAYEAMALVLGKRFDDERNDERNDEPASLPEAKPSGDGAA